jgi:hypothetical protein
MGPVPVERLLPLIRRPDTARLASDNSWPGHYSGEVERPTKLAGLRKLPVGVSWEWQAKTVATRNPRGEHTEWRLEMELSASSPFLAALMVETSSTTRNGRIPASSAHTRLQVSLIFGPWDWHQSPDVSLAVNQRAKGVGDGVRTLLSSEPVKLAPPEHTEFLVENGLAETGTKQPLLAISDLAVISCVLVDRSDVLVSHDRWRVPESSLGPELTWLATGRRSG